MNISTNIKLENINKLGTFFISCCNLELGNNNNRIYILWRIDQINNRWKVHDRSDCLFQIEIVNDEEKIICQYVGFNFIWLSTTSSLLALHFFFRFISYQHQSVHLFLRPFFLPRFSRSFVIAFNLARLRFKHLNNGIEQKDFIIGKKNSFLMKEKRKRGMG